MQRYNPVAELAFRRLRTWFQEGVSGRRAGQIAAGQIKKKKKQGATRLPR